MARPRNTDKTMKKITEIRAANNWLWMNILRLAVEAKPEQARHCIKQIQKNDKEVTKWLGKL